MRNDRSPVLWVGLLVAPIWATQAETRVQPGSVSAFVVSAGQRIEGVALAAPPSTANCEARCQSLSACLGYSLSRDGICQLYGAVWRLAGDPRWRSGVRISASRRPDAE